MLSEISTENNYQSNSNANANLNNIPSRKTMELSVKNFITDDDDLMEYFDLTQDDDDYEKEDSIKEENKNQNKQDFNEINKLTLGKKRYRQDNNANNANNNKKIKNTITDSDCEENSINNIINFNANTNNNIPCVKNNTNKNNENEKNALLSLVKREGFNNIFNLISNSQFNRDNSVEKELEEIIFNIGLLRTSIILLQIKFNNSSYDLMPYNNFPIFQKNIEEQKRIEEAKRMKNLELELGEHLHKEKDGKIYKYLKHHFRVKGYVFYCGDKKCRSKGLYNMQNMKFRILEKHTIPHEKHNYIVSKNIYNQYQSIFEDFNSRNCHEAQVFKNNMGDKLIQWYDN